MGPDTCYYDAQCGLCRRTTRILRALDWLGNLRFEDLAADPPVPYERAVVEGMPMRAADGRVLVGFPAVRRALRRTPLGLPLALALHLPGVSHAGRAAYRLVAANRRRDACAPQPR
jgi:predicted DCC family thiol-disulfide oxidoreductase YuxK